MNTTDIKKITWKCTVFNHILKCSDQMGNRSSKLSISSSFYIADT